MPLTPTLRYILIGAIVVIIFGLGGWYFFIRAKQAGIETGDAGRGLGEAPSFVSRVGSTYENIVSTLTETFTGERESGSEFERERLSQVSKTPTAGAGFVGSGTSTRLRFVERGTGYVFDFTPETGALERLTNTLVPRTYEAHIGASGRMITRSEEEDGSFSTAKARIATTTAAGETLYPLLRTFLPNSITTAVLSPENDELFYIVDTDTGGRGMRAAWAGGAEREIFSSMISGWRAWWLPSGKLVLAQYASDGAVGYAYEIGESGRMTVLVRGLGLTFLPHPREQAFISGASTNDLSLFVRAGTSSTDTLLPLKTIADKCVWHPRELTAYCATPQTKPAANFLDLYHRGEIHTSDAWWRIDARDGEVELLLPTGNATIDVERPVIDDSGERIAFINALDKSLWILEIPNE